MLTLACGYLFFRSFHPSGTFRALVIQDSSGRNVLIAARTLPGAIINGKEYNRSVKIGGFVLYDSRGNETGGIGMINDSSFKKATVIDFDYALNDAIEMHAFDRGATFESGLTINDKDFHTNDPHKVHLVERIAISDKDKNASIILRDSKGRDRIVLSVDSNDVAKIELKDSAGNIVR